MYLYINHDVIVGRSNRKILTKIFNISEKIPVLHNVI